jgi:hypothetical protein
MDLDEMRAATGQLLDLAGARARQRVVPQPVRRRRKRSREPFSVTVRVDLVGGEPSVWRGLELPSTLRLDELHGVLQAVFGWTDSHLHRFSLGDSAWDDGAERFLCPYDVEEGEDDGIPACDVRLDEVLTRQGDHLLYTYDYGDEWNHRLVVEAVGEPVTAVQCTGGRGAAPPEDSGGIWDWDAGAAPPFDLAEAQAALALWEVERALPPEIAQLLRHVALLPAEAVVRDLVDAADLNGPADVDQTTAADALRRYVWLLHRVGDGLPLTAAGWLPPAVVREAMDALWPDDRWIGKRNREDLTSRSGACGPPPSGSACCALPAGACSSPRPAPRCATTRSGCGSTSPSGSPAARRTPSRAPPLSCSSSRRRAAGSTPSSWPPR